MVLLHQTPSPNWDGCLRGVDEEGLCGIRQDEVASYLRRLRRRFPRF